jgi:hypothetical protein
MIATGGSGFGGLPPGIGGLLAAIVVVILVVAVLKYFLDN